VRNGVTTDRNHRPVVGAHNSQTANFSVAIVDLFPWSERGHDRQLMYLIGQMF
jgi:hypothetical protein